MADPDRLSPAQERALTRVRQEGRLYSRDGVTRPTIRRLEKNGLVRVTWSRRSPVSRRVKGGWCNQVEHDWVAEPVIDDYQVYLRTEWREFRLTVYAALSPHDAICKARKRFFEIYCDGSEIPIEMVKADPISGALFFLS